MVNKSSKKKVKSKDIVDPKDRSHSDFRRSTNQRKQSRKTKNDDELKGKFSSDETSHKFNDVSWYAKNNQMLIDSASYSYNNPIGNSFGKLYEKAPVLANLTDVTENQSVPSVPALMALKVQFTPGTVNAGLSSANLAAQNIYSYVRYMNSGAKNYDQADLLMYLLAMDSLYAYWNWMKRIYGYAAVFSQYNRTMPRVFASADNVDLDNIVANLADFRLFLNRAAASISSFCVPAVMPYFVRHSWMFSNIYKDSNNNKAQMYMFVPASFYTLNETASEFGTSLVASAIIDVSTAWTVDLLIAKFNTMIEAVAYSEDVGVMSGDILKAYGNEKLFKLAAVDPDYTVLPVYNEEVLNQIHNSNCVPVQVTQTTISQFNITQNPSSGNIEFGPLFSMNGSGINIVNHGLYPNPNKYLINMPWDNVTPANTMVGTRLKTAYTIVGTSSAPELSLDAVGSEFITGRNIYYADTLGVIKVVYSARDFIMFGFLANEASETNDLTEIAVISQFDWHPIVSLYYGAGAVVGQSSSSSITQVGMLGDISNYTFISTDDLKKLHETAIMSEFNIPQLASF